MPLPLGHAVIGLTTQHLFFRENAVFKQLKMCLLVIILANLPDIDVLIGLVFWGNGNAIHRGPTHSLAFALLMACLFSITWRFFSFMPKISFLNGFLVILSHVLADHFLTQYPVSFFWPFETIFSVGSSGWGDVICRILFENLRDMGIIVACFLLILINLLAKYVYRQGRGRLAGQRRPDPVIREPIKKIHRP